MLSRIAERQVEELLDQFPAVALLGPRQVGKTTLAQSIAQKRRERAVYLDLELPSDRAKLADPEAYLAEHRGQLMILDEIHRAPDLFGVLRGVIDQRRREQQRTAQFLLLGSASIDLMRQSAESLAGRIAHVQLPGLLVNEVANSAPDAVSDLWIRGGFPDSFLAPDDRASFRWRQEFIRTYLERDIPALGPRVPAETLRRLWTMLAHEQGSQLNMARLAASLGTGGGTVNRYVDLLVDLLLVRRLQPLLGNHGKRLTRSPKVYLTDSGVVHALLGAVSLDDVLGHPVAGGSWEGFVIDNLIAAAPAGTQSWFYRTSAGAELDLVLELNSHQRWAIEIKRSSAPVLSRGFHSSCRDIAATTAIAIYPGHETYSLGNGATAMSIASAVKRLHKLAEV